jgi:hypothetical protein
MDERLVREFWRIMEDRDVNEFLLAVFIEWVRKAGRGNCGIIGAEAPLNSSIFPLIFRRVLPRNKGRPVLGRWCSSGCSLENF